MSAAIGTIGRFTTDSALVVQTWDEWMSTATGISESAATGVSVATLFPELAERGLLARLRRVAEGAGVEVLAPALHKYLIPCAPMDANSRLERMRQHVIVAPILDDGGAVGVSVTIEDVTARFERGAQASSGLDSQEEFVRLLAARELAADATSSSLLSAALGDDSWRVRRVAAEGLASNSSQDVVAILLEAVREHHRDAGLLNAAITALGRSRKDIALDVMPMLASDDTDVRTYAALALGIIGDVRSVEPLTDMLGDADANVQYHAIEALGRIGDRRAADALVRVALSRDFFLAFPALDALAAINDSSIAPLLTALLDDPFLAVSAASCLGTIGSDDVIVPLVGAITGVDAPVASLAGAIADISARLHEDGNEGALVSQLVQSSATQAAADALISALASAGDDERRGLLMVLSWLSLDGVDAALAPLLEVESIRRLVADRLARRGVRAAPLVEAFTTHEDSDVRRAAAFALGGIGSAGSVPPLLAMLRDDPEPELILAVVTALGSLGDARPFEQLLMLLDHEDTTVRQAAVAALNSIAPPALEESIAARLAHSSSRVRESATRIAGYFNYASCLDAVIACTRDVDPVVRRAAIESLATYDMPAGWAAIHAAMSSDADASVRAAGARALALSALPESCAVLVSALTDANLWVRYHAVRSCARCEKPDVDMIAGLISRLTADRAAPVRVAAIDALSALGVTSVFELLAAAATDSDDDVSCAALSALREYSSDEATRVLLHALEHGHPRQQHAALDALGVRGRGSETVVFKVAADSSDAMLAQHAISTLGRMGSPAAIDALIGLGRRPARRRDVVRALGTPGSARVRLLASSLGAASHDDKPLLIEALGATGADDVAKIIALYLASGDAGVQRIAEQTLARLDRRSF